MCSGKSLLNNMFFPANIYIHAVFSHDQFSSYTQIKSCFRFMFKYTQIGVCVCVCVCIQNIWLLGTQHSAKQLADFDWLA